MTDHPPTGPLPCGTDVADLLDQVADGLPRGGHAAGCPYCQDALARLGGRWSAVRSAAAEPVSPPPSLVSRTLRRLRAERAVGAGRLEVPGDRGSLRVGPRAVVTLAREAARRVAGVRVTGGRYDADRLTLAVSVRQDLPAQQIAESVRDRVRREIDRDLGVPAPMIDIDVVDVWY